MDMSKYKTATAILNMYSELLSSVTSDRCITHDIYTTLGINSLAILAVDIPDNIELGSRYKPEGFVYKEEDKVYICIEKSLDIRERNYAKAYLLGVYLFNKNTMKNGIFPELFFYPETLATDVSEELEVFTRNVLLPEEEFKTITTDLMKKAFQSTTNKLSATVADNTEKQALQDLVSALDLVKVAKSEDKIDVPEAITEQAQMGLEMICNVYQVPRDVILARFVDLYGCSYDRLTREVSILTDEQLTAIIEPLNRHIHTLNWGTFESSQVVIDLLKTPEEQDIEVDVCSDGDASKREGNEVFGADFTTEAGVEGKVEDFTAPDAESNSEDAVFDLTGVLGVSGEADDWGDTDEADDWDDADVVDQSEEYSEEDDLWSTDSDEELLEVFDDVEEQETKVFEFPRRTADVICGDDNFTQNNAECSGKGFGSLDKLDFSQHIEAVSKFDTTSIAEAIAELMQKRAIGRNMYKSQGVFFEEAELKEIVEASIRGYMRSKGCTALLLRAYKSGFLTFKATQETAYVDKLPIFETVQPLGEFAVSDIIGDNDYVYTFKEATDIRGKLKTVFDLLSEFELLSKQQGVEIRRLDEEQNVLLHKLECAASREECHKVADELYAHRQRRVLVKQQDELMKRLKLFVTKSWYAEVKEVIQNSLLEMDKVLDDMLNQDGDNNE